MHELPAGRRRRAFVIGAARTDVARRAPGEPSKAEPAAAAGPAAPQRGAALDPIRRSSAVQRASAASAAPKRQSDRLAKDMISQIPPNTATAPIRSVG